MAVSREIPFDGCNFKFWPRFGRLREGKQKTGDRYERVQRAQLSGSLCTTDDEHSIPFQRGGCEQHLLDMVVRRLAGDDHVVHVTLSPAGAGDADEAGFLLQFPDAVAARHSPSPNATPY